MTEHELKQLEEALSKDASPEARQIRDLIDQVRGLRSLIDQARAMKEPPPPRSEPPAANPL